MIVGNRLDCLEHPALNTNLERSKHRKIKWHTHTHTHRKNRQAKSQASFLPTYGCETFLDSVQKSHRQMETGKLTNIQKKPSLTKYLV